MLETSERIIEKTTELFKNYGIRSVTMDEIAKELGISKKTIYQYYKDKNALVTAFTETRVTEDTKKVESVICESTDTIDEMFRMSNYIRQLLKQTNPIILYELKRYYPAAWEIQQKFIKGFVMDTITESISKGIQEGIFREDIDIEIIARMRIYQIQMGFDQTIFPISDFDITEVQMQFFDHFVYGICSSQGFEKLNKYKISQSTNN